MKTLRFLSIFTLLFFSLGAIAQLPFFTANYSPTATFEGSFPNPSQGDLVCVNNMLVYNNFQNGLDYRFQELINGGLANTLKWKAHFEFKLDPVSTNDYGAILFALNSSDQHFRNDMNASSISVWYGDALGNSGGSYLFIRSKRGSNWDLPSAKIYIGPHGTTYYATVERTSPREFILALFYDQLRTNLKQKICYTAEGDVDLSSLQTICPPNCPTTPPETYLQQGVSTTGNLNRRCSGYIKDLKIYNDNDLDCAECEITACLVYDDSSPCYDNFVDCSFTGPNSQKLGGIITFGDGKYSTINSSLKYKYSSTGQPKDVCITSFAYYYNGVDYECCSDQQCITIIPDAYDACEDEISTSTIRDLPLPNNEIYCNIFPRVQASKLEGCVNSPIIFSNTSTIGVNNIYLGSVINFGDGGSAQVGLNGSATHHYTQPGIYEVCITVFTSIINIVGGVPIPMCCKEVHCITVEVGICSDQSNPFRLKSGYSEEANRNFTIQPNPFNDQFSIKVEEGISEIQIYSAEGARVRTIIPNGNSNLNIDLSDEPNGIYLIRAIKAGEVITRKVIKQ